MKTIDLPRRAVPAYLQLLPTERVAYPEDRKYWEAVNRREFEKKLAAGVVRRRPKGD